MRSLEARTELVEQFVSARTRLADGKVADAMAQCETMIGAFISIYLFLFISRIGNWTDTCVLCTADPRSRDEREVSIRIGDVYAMMVEHWYQSRDLKRCRQLVNEMRRDAGLQAEPYLEAAMLAEIEGTSALAEVISPTEDDGYLHGGDEEAAEFYMDEEVDSDGG